MAKYYKKKKAYRKKMRRNVKRRSSRFNRPAKGFQWRAKLLPDKLAIKFKYSTQKFLTGTHSQIVYMCGNSAYDPDPAVGGAQPPLYDEIATMYSTYKVIGAKCSCTFINEGPAPATVYIYPTLSSSENFSLTSPNKIMDQQYASYKTLTSGLGSQNKCTLSKYMSTRKMYGVRQTDDDLFYSATNNNPNNIWYFGIGGYDYTTADVPLNITVEITMTYYTIMTRRITQAQD